MRSIRLISYMALLSLAILATKWKISSIEGKQGGEIVSISKIWAKDGKPVTIEQVQKMKLPNMRKMSATVMDDGSLEAYVSLKSKNRDEVWPGCFTCI